MAMEVDGRRPPGRPKKSWRRCIMEDMNELGIREDMAEDMSGEGSSPVQPNNGKEDVKSRMMMNVERCQYYQMAF